MLYSVPITNVLEDQKGAFKNSAYEQSIGGAEDLLDGNNNKIIFTYENGEKSLIYQEKLSYKGTSLKWFTGINWYLPIKECGC